MKIGVLDSGVGGFSVLRELHRLMPGEQYFYLSDQDYSPYGDKDTHYVRQRLHVLTDELLAVGVDLIVVACHTATAEAIESLRDDYSVPFVGIEPYLNVLNDVTSKSRQYVVLTTLATAKSSRFNALRERLDPQHLLEIYPCQQLASLIEAYFHDEIERQQFQEAIERELELVLQLKQQRPNLTSAILGCTHYPLISDWIERISGLETVFPGEAVARRTKERLHHFFAYSAESHGFTNGFQYRRRVVDSWQQRPWNYLQKVSVIG